MFYGTTCISNSANTSGIRRTGRTCDSISRVTVIPSVASTRAQLVTLINRIHNFFAYTIGRTCYASSCCTIIVSIRRMWTFRADFIADRGFVIAGFAIHAISTRQISSVIRTCVANAAFCRARSSWSQTLSIEITVITFVQSLHSLECVIFSCWTVCAYRTTSYIFVFSANTCDTRCVHAWASIPRVALTDDTGGDTRGIDWTQCARRQTCPTRPRIVFSRATRTARGRARATLIFSANTRRARTSGRAGITTRALRADVRDQRHNKQPSQRAHARAVRRLYTPAPARCI